MKNYPDEKHYSEKHIKADAACMADERLTGQERIHRLLTGKVELKPAEWLRVTAAVYMVAPARAAGIVEAAKSREGAKMHELLSDLRNQMSQNPVAATRTTWVAKKNDDGTSATDENGDIVIEQITEDFTDYAFDPAMLRRIDTAILSCFAIPVFTSLTWRRMCDTSGAGI